MHVNETAIIKVKESSFIPTIVARQLPCREAARAIGADECCRRFAASLSIARQFLGLTPKAKCGPLKSWA